MSGPSSSAGKVGDGKGHFDQYKIFKFTSNEVACAPKPEALANLLRVCSKCDKVPPPMSYTCQMGHVTCYDCANQTETLKCPVEKCSEELKVVACHPVTSLFSKLILVCPSCQKTVKGNELVSHEAECIGIAIFKCQFTACLERTVSHTEISLLDHLIEDHNVPQFDLSGKEIINLPLIESGVLRNVGVWKVACLIKYKEDNFMCTFGRAMIGQKVSLVIIVYNLSNKPDDLYRLNPFHGYITFAGTQGFLRSYYGMFPSTTTPKENVIQSSCCLIIAERMIPPGCRCLQIGLQKDDEKKPKEAIGAE